MKHLLHFPLRLLSVILIFHFSFFVFSFSAWAEGRDSVFSAEPIPDSVFARMQGKSWPADCTMERKDFSYLRLSYIDEKGATHIGEMVCHSSIAPRVLHIFRELFAARYPIHSIRLIDDFDADDETSMRANNTSCFCYRRIAGSQKLSKHSMGKAIDLNPLYNPHVRTRTNEKGEARLVVQPATATLYADRSHSFPMKITTSDLAYTLFKQQGFSWGGEWRTSKDYQHFEE